MLVLARILAALVAAALYHVFWWLVTVAVLLVATWRELDVPGYHEPGASAWWGWLLALVWWIGLAAVAWWAAFRLPWLRRANRLRV